jgi:hypothetical protein
MVYIVNDFRCPPGKNPDVGAKYLEALKKFPPDPSLGKTLIVMVRATAEGTHVLGIGKPAKGKLEENIKRMYESNQMFADIEGVRFEIKTYLDFTEAYKVINLAPPKEV